MTERAFEVLILGDLVVRAVDGVIPPLTDALVETLVLLAAWDRPVKADELKRTLRRRPSDGSLQQYISKLKKCGLPIVSSGVRSHMEYALEATRCEVDAREFTRGVGAGLAIDELLRLWRGGVDHDLLATDAWAAVKTARSELILRIAALPEPEQAALSELARFAALFPGDKEIDLIRPHGPGSRPRLLLVEDDLAMMTEIQERLEASYRTTPIASIEEWRTFRKHPQNLERIDGALIDLHLTSSLNDRRGIEIVKYLRDQTEIPAVLFTANGLERSGVRHQRRMAEYRLVDIVDKRTEDWWDALEAACGLLTGIGETERRWRLETWLETAHLGIQRETDGAPPGSVAAKRRLQSDREYLRVLGLVKLDDIDVAEREVDRFCRRQPSSR